MKRFDLLIKDIKKLKDEDPLLCEQLKKYVYDILGCCMEVHRDMGPYLNEYMYLVRPLRGPQGPKVRLVSNVEPHQPVRL